MLLSIPVFCDVILCPLGLLHPEDEGNEIFPPVNNHLPVDILSEPIRICFEICVEIKIVSNGNLFIVNC